MGRGPRDPNRKYHDRVAPIYDSMFEGSPYWDLFRTLTWETIKEHLPPDQKGEILDAGGGTGYWAIRLAKSGYRVVLSDYSQGMLDTAAKKIAKLSPPIQLPMTVSDLQDLKEFEDGRFRMVVAQGDPLSIVERTDRALAAVFRVLEPGGVLIGSVDNIYSGIDHFLQDDKLDGLLAYLRNGRTRWRAKREGEDFELRTFRESSIRKLVEAAGLTVIRIQGKVHLPWRRYPALLEDNRNLKRALEIERLLTQDPTMMGQASHLEVIARRPDTSLQ